MSTQPNNVTLGKQATEAMMRGFKVASQAIRKTYGPKGLNAVIESEDYPFHQIANDAQTIVQAIHIDDRIERRGLGFLKELMDKSNKDSGDGRKTTAIIAEEILDAGYESVLSGLELKKELDNLIPLIEQKIDEQKKTITPEEVEGVASVAGESKELGKTLGEIYQVIGKEGIIHLEGSGTFATSYSLINGIRFYGAGYLSSSMVHDPQSGNRKETLAVYDNPTILVSKRKINYLSEINPLLDRLIQKGKKDLVIFTDDMASDVASTLVKVHKDKIMNIVIIRAPVLWKNYVFEDFAKITGSTIVEDSTGITWKNLTLDHLGTCGKIIVGEEETTVLETADISDHIATLKTRGDTDSLLRLSWLTTKSAILRLGANSESELSYLRLKAADAINSSRLALQDGVVPGAGVCLEEVANSLPGSEAGEILRKALRAPSEQIRQNGTLEQTVVWDAARVVKNAVRNAISLASTILTAGLVVTIPPKSAEQIAAEALQASGRRF